MARPTSLRTIVSRIFATSPRPIYMLDAAQRVVFHNAALTDWLELPERDLVGLMCIYAPIESTSSSISEADLVLGRGLATPPQTKELGEFQGMIRSTRGDSRTVGYYRLNDEDDSTLVVLGETDEQLTLAESFDAATVHALASQLRKDWNQAYRLDCLIGQSAGMRQVRAQVQLAASAACNVVVVGRPGTGRQTVARTIHREQSAAQQLVPLDCGLLDVDLLQTTIESIVRQMAENQDTSTLLLLGVDQLSLEAQATLVGFLEIGELGFSALATSGHQLAELVAQQKFRHDLACQLSSLVVCLPSLADRIEDLPTLAQWMLEKSKHRSRLGGFDEEAMHELLRYRFPGEIAELEAIVEEAATAATGALITAADLPRKLSFAADADSLPDVVIEEIELDAFLSEVESELIARALKYAKGNRAQAARLLGVSRGKLLRRIEQLGVGDEA